MYVFRPQHAGTHQAGCGGHQGSRVARTGRQGLKAQRRAKQCKQQTRQRPPLRRRQQLRDTAGFHDEGCEPAAPEDGPVDDGHGPGDRCCSRAAGRGVRERLRQRLVERSAQELTGILERRHADRWAHHVLTGGFRADEGMKRICEAFGLRPQLERQVLQAVSRRASALDPSATLMQKGPPQALGLYAEHCAPQTATAAPSDADEESAWTPSASDVAEDEEYCFLEAGGILSPPQEEDLAPASCTKSARIPHEGEVGKQEEEDEEEDSEEEEEEEAVIELPAMEVKGPQASPSTPLWRAPWKARVLRTLGLDRWLRDGEDVDQPCLAPTPKVGADDVESELDEEELELSCKLVAAVRNAERHIASSREQRVRDLQACEEGHDGWRQVRSSSKVPSTTAKRKTAIKFGGNSHIRFFTPDVVVKPQAYERKLWTKSFDGPSGHKARQSCPGSPDSEGSTVQPSSGDELESEEEEDEEEEWEDECDEIADLMCQERAGVLWSTCW